MPTVVCPKCRNDFNAAGTSVRCPRCGTVVSMLGGSAPAEGNQKTVAISVAPAPLRPQPLGGSLPASGPIAAPPSGPMSGPQRTIAIAIAPAPPPPPPRVASASMPTPVIAPVAVAATEVTDAPAPKRKGRRIGVWMAALGLVGAAGVALVVLRSHGGEEAKVAEAARPAAVDTAPPTTAAAPAPAVPATTVATAPPTTATAEAAPATAAVTTTARPEPPAATVATAPASASPKPAATATPTADATRASARPQPTIVAAPPAAPARPSAAAATAAKPVAKPDKAAQDKQALDLARAYVDVGDAKMRGGDASGAVASYREALRVAPWYSPPLRALGLAYMQQRDSAKAIAAFEQYLRFAPNAPDADRVRMHIATLKNR